MRSIMRFYDSWLLLLATTCLFHTANGRSPTPWLFKLFEKPIQAAQQEITSQITETLHPFSLPRSRSGKRLRRNQCLFQPGTDTELLWTPHDDIMHAGNSASYFLSLSGQWAGRVANEKDSFIGIRAENTNWNVASIEGFQLDIEVLSSGGSGDRQLCMVLCDHQGVEWSAPLRLKQGDNQVQIALQDFEPIVQVEESAAAVVDKTENQPPVAPKPPKIPTSPGTITSLTILYAKMEYRKKTSNRKFTPGDFRVKITSIKTY